MVPLESDVLYTGLRACRDSPGHLREHVVYLTVFLGNKDLVLV